MNRIRLVNLLDDFGLGGVQKGLSIFESPAIKAVADCSTCAIAPDAIIAPALDADIIVTHFPPNWQRLAFLVSLRLRNPKARLIHVEHSYTGEWEAAYVPHKARFRLMLTLAFSRVDHVVAVSQGQAQWLAEAARLAPDRLTVIHPYSVQGGLALVPDVERPSIGPLNIGAYGRFHDQKGFDTLIRAFRLIGPHAGIELLLGGFGPDDAMLRSLAGDAPHIRFFGRIDDVASFLGRCQAIAVPSRFEAFGQVANEAREAGRPILVSPVGGLPEQVGEAGVIADCATPESLAAAIRHFCTLNLARMGQAGRDATRGCGAVRASQWAELITGQAARATRNLPRPGASAPRHA